MQKRFCSFRIKPPLSKGGGPRSGGGIQFAVSYKHNKNLTSRAKQLRKNMTKEEKHLWFDFLRSYPVRFLRQKVIDNYIVDFYCSGAHLIIELDGSQHYFENGLIYDKMRTEKLEQRNLTVLRIPNNMINYHFESVCEHIDNEVKRLMKSDVTKG